MGAKQSLEETDAPASPRSPTSPRVVPADGETSMPAYVKRELTETRQQMTEMAATQQKILEMLQSARAEQSS